MELPHFPPIHESLGLPYGVTLSFALRTLPYEGTM